MESRREVPKVAHTDVIDEVPPFGVNGGDARGPSSIKDHSACLCQCSSRTPPGFRRMFTPASVVATGNSRAVTSRVQPPSSRRMGASENENRRLGMVPRSVSGGRSMSGFWRSRSHVARAWIARAGPSPRIGSGAVAPGLVGSHVVPCRPRHARRAAAVASSATAATDAATSPAVLRSARAGSSR